MIAQLRGRVVDILPTRIVLDVGGVGYALAIPPHTDVLLDTEITLFTYLAVRENALDLYGFGTKVELAMFHELIKLPKIGPKTALQILSQASVDMLTQAARTNDPSFLSKTSGIGKKSAEKIVTGLREVNHLDSLTGEYGAIESNDSDVIDALIALGYSQRDALTAVQKIPKDILETKARVTFALKSISG